MNNLSIDRQLKHLNRIIREERERLEDMEDRVAIQEALVRGIEAAYGVITADYSIEEEIDSACDLSL